MKKYFLNHCMEMVKKKCPEYNEEKLLEIRYGLEGLYLTITKLIVVFMVAIILGIVKEMVIIMLLYNGLRLFGFGIHATKSWMCLVSSLITFICIPYLAINLVIPISIKILLLSVCVSCFFLYAPADTEKHPIIKKKRRQRLKIAASIICVIYSFFCLYINNDFMSNAFLFALLIETSLIIPITYKIFKLPYNNYKTYLLNN